MGAGRLSAAGTHGKNNKTMKKRLLAIAALVLFIASVAVSCTHHTCPAYRGSVVENVEQ